MRKTNYHSIRALTLLLMIGWSLSARAAHAGLNARATAKMYWQVGNSAGLAGRNSTDSLPKFIITVHGLQSFRGADLQLYLTGQGLRGVPQAWQIQSTGCAEANVTFSRSFTGTYSSAFTSVPGLLPIEQQAFYLGSPSTPNCPPPNATELIWMASAGSGGVAKDSTKEYGLYSVAMDLTTGCEGDAADSYGPQAVTIKPFFNIPCGMGLPNGIGIEVLDANNNADFIPLTSGYDSLTWQNGKLGDFAPSTWNIENIGSITHETNIQASIALDPQGQTAVCYRSADSTLKLATRTNSGWSVETAVDSGGWANDLAFDGGGNPHISYYSPRSGQLKHAVKSSGTWTTEVVDAHVNLQSDIASTSIAISPAGDVGIVYQYNAGELEYSYKLSGGSTWSRDGIDNSNTHICCGTGVLTYDASSKPRIAYNNWYYIHAYPPDHYFLRYASKATGSWVYETVDSGVAGGAGIKIDPSGNPVIGYQRFDECGDACIANYVVRVAKRSGGGTWTCQTADSGASATAFGPKALALDSQGLARLAYLQETSPYKIRYAAEKSAGGWIVRDIDIDSSHTQLAWPQLTLTSLDIPRISYLDRQHWNARWAYPSGNPTGVPSGPGAEIASRSSLKIYGSPNPFSSGTVIHFALSKPEPNLKVEVLQVDGRRIATLWNGSAKAGEFRVPWNGRSAGRRMAAGIYMVRVVGTRVVGVGRVNLIR